MDVASNLAYSPNPAYLMLRMFVALRWGWLGGVSVENIYKNLPSWIFLPFQKSSLKLWWHKLVPTHSVGAWCGRSWNICVKFVCIKIKSIELLVTNVTQGLWCFSLFRGLLCQNILQCSCCCMSVHQCITLTLQQLLHRQKFVSLWTVNVFPTSVKTSTFAL